MELTRRPSKDLTGLNPRERRVLDSLPPSEKANVSGIAGDQMIEPIPVYNQATCEKVIEGQNNAFIVLGRDRVTGIMTGYGGIGHSGCGAIDIVAGRGSYQLRDNANSPINPHPMLDASKVYISQKTDIDRNFNIVKGNVGQSVGRAGIAIKSDAVRIIARDGIKLVTGTDRKNSKGANRRSVSGIDLIAGNNDGDLQPLVKGGNLSQALNSIIDNVNQLNGILDSFLTYQIKFNTALMDHTHPDTINMAIGILAEGNPAALTGGSSLASPQVIKAGTKNLLSLNGITKKDLASNKINIASTRFTYLEPMGTTYINSRHNSTN